MCKCKEQETVEVKIRYVDDECKIEKIALGDWIDLRSQETIRFHPFKFKLIDLGFAMELPDGYEAHAVPRSSTYKKWRVIQANHMGVIDNSYAGNNDIWKFPALGFGFRKINKGDRICQFRIVKKQPTINFVEVDNLEKEDRGGIGSTGVK